ncbi:hypothetical protein C8J57DRAFT_1500851 [Mycena rebaudengoi]|nr:hypothetical protein C8J57DRAFT_1500851 [Mycena rebaudengoi]
MSRILKLVGDVSRIVLSQSVSGRLHELSGQERAIVAPTIEGLLKGYGEGAQDPTEAMLASAVAMYYHVGPATQPWSISSLKCVDGELSPISALRRESFEVVLGIIGLKLAKTQTMPEEETSMNKCVLAGIWPETSRDLWNFRDKIWIREIPNTCTLFSAFVFEFYPTTTMKFTTALFSFVPLVTALPPAVRTVEAEVRNATVLVSPAPNIQGNVDACLDVGFQNCQILHGSSGQCVDFPAGLNDGISSFGPDSDQDCFIFFCKYSQLRDCSIRLARSRSDFSCTGFQAGPIRNPGISDLRDIGFNVISSFKCFFG